MRYTREQTLIVWVLTSIVLCAARDSRQKEARMTGNVHAVSTCPPLLLRLQPRPGLLTEVFAGYQVLIACTVLSKSSFGCTCNACWRRAVETYIPPSRQMVCGSWLLVRWFGSKVPGHLFSFLIGNRQLRQRQRQQAASGSVQRQRGPGFRCPVAVGFRYSGVRGQREKRVTAGCACGAVEAAATTAVAPNSIQRGFPLGR